MSNDGPRLFVVPLELAEANAYVVALHRHHDRMQVHRFSLGVITDDGALHGVAICARPAARALSSRDVLEVSRLCTDGTRNACSALYGAAARAAKAMGYRRVQTYILDSETGVSLRAAGWRLDGLTDLTTETSHNWNVRPGRRSDPNLWCRKGRWVKDLGERPALIDKAEASTDIGALTLNFDEASA